MLPTATVLPLGCIRFNGLPDMTPGSAADPRIYASDKNTYSANVAAGRWLVRSANISWDLVGTAGETFATTAEIRERFGGVIFVGDSQIREVAWAAFQMLTPGQSSVFAKQDRVFAGQKLRHGSCVPQSVGKTGFTASCPALPGGACQLHSPFQNKSHAESMRRLLLTRPHSWDGMLSVHESVCETDFFISYQATWGAMPVEPTSVPRCLHPQGGADVYEKPHGNGMRKPVLWIVDGCGLHEMEFCDARRDALPQNVLPHFPDGLLRSGTVVYQTVGAGFMMRAANRFRGECAQINADQIAAKERAWLDSKGVRYYDYTRLALQYAPLMFDAIHFTYYWVPCAYTFPEMARLVAQLGFQRATAREAEYCLPGTAQVGSLPSTPRAGASEAPALHGTLRLSLGQDEASVSAAYAAALRLSAKGGGKAAVKGGGKGSSKGSTRGKGVLAGGGGSAASKRAARRPS